MKIAVLSNTSWYLYNFRLNLMLALKSAGHQVFAIGPEDDYVEKIKQAGIQHLAFNVSGDGTNPFAELKTLVRLHTSLKQHNIELIFSNTPKGNIYSNLAALPLRIPVIPNVSGLGRTFIRPNLITVLVKLLYRFSFRANRRIFFQNNDDKSLFEKLSLIKPEQAILLSGSGVDLQRFTPQSSSSNKSEKFTFILIARLLWDKGIAEYVAAATIIHQKHSNCRFLLLGQLDVANPAAISQEQVHAWQKAGVIEYLGKTDNVIPFLADSDCVVLPSYREGTPRSLLEAAAMAKPIVTTDTVGCRNTVDDEMTGFLCEVKNAEDLADKMLAILKLPTHQRLKMGQAGRVKMEQEFDEQLVINKYFTVIDELFPLNTI